MANNNIRTIHLINYNNPGVLQYYQKQKNPDQQICFLEDIQSQMIDTQNPSVFLYEKLGEIGTRKAVKNEILKALQEENHSHSIFIFADVMDLLMFRVVLEEKRDIFGYRLNVQQFSDTLAILGNLYLLKSLTGGENGPTIIFSPIEHNRQPLKGEERDHEGRESLFSPKDFYTRKN